MAADLAGQQVIRTSPTIQMEGSATGTTARNIPEFLTGGGEMGQLIRDYDWSSSPLGPVASWPQSLRTCIRIMLTSRQPIWIGWGKELIKLYNDPYKAIVGGKHPWAMGKPASVVWKDIWRDIDPMLRQVMEEDQGTYVESQLLIMERNGYPEETYYTFSYTPIPGDDGTTAGMICANSDDTDRIISERQLRTLSLLGKSLTDARSNRDVINGAMHALQDNAYDFPFALFYTITDNKAILAAGTPADMNAPIPSQIALDGGDELSRLLSEAISTRKVQLFGDLQAVMGELPRGAWEIAPDKAILLPVVQASSKEPFGVLIAGFNPYRLLDEKYSSFFSLIADQIATSFSDVHILEEERKRAEALAEIDRAKTTFFSNISHEFRTPLTLLLGPIEEVLTDPATLPENRVRMDVAYRNALRMQKLVNTLLDFSRIEAGRMDGRFARVNIGALTADLASTFRSAVEKAGMELVLELRDIRDEVYVDTDMWEKIVLNLISNAFKYSRQGSIRIGVQQEDDRIILSVADTGVGIPADQLDKIFSRFHRVEHAEGRSQEGTGIGLALVKELVKLHGGSIEVASEPGKGSVFTVYIPAGSAHLSPDKIVETDGVTPSSNPTAYLEEARKWLPAAAAQESADSQTPGLHHTILLADDNADMRDYVQRLLSDHYDVITAVNGIDAYEQMQRRRPALLLTDIMMPQLDGFGLLRKVRSNPELQHTPVIFLSARAGEEAKVEGLDAGADDYLVKPFSAKELTVRVTNHIRINQVRRETEQQFFQLFLQAPAIINVFKGPEHRYEFFHPRNRELFGDVDFTGMTIQEALPELEKQGIMALLDEVYREGKTIIQRERPLYFLRGREEQLRYLNFTYQPWRDLHGRIQGVLSFAIDVTGSVESRKKAEESERQFRTVMVESPSLFAIIKEPEMILTFGNEPFFRSLGRTPDAIGKRLLDVLPELRDQPFPGLLQEVYATARPCYGNEVKAVLIKNGVPNELYYNYVFQPILTSRGTVSGVTIMASDITEQVAARQKIEESEKRFRTLAETLPQLIWMTDARGGQLYASSRWHEYSGLEPVQERWMEIVHPADAELVHAVWNSAVPGGGHYRMEVRLKSRQGTYRWFYGQAEPIRNEQGAITRWIGSFTDIQDRKDTEQRLEKLVTERTEALQRSNEDLQQFAHVASHDLKEPVRKIKTFGSRLRKELSEELTEKGRLFVDKILTATDRMYSMIEGVLNYSTLNAEHQPAVRLDLNALIQSIRQDLELPIQQQEATIEHGPLPPVEGAPVLIYQLFYNLINNSLKFARPGVKPVISIHAEESGEPGMARIIVRDNGIGFEQEYAGRIFETFTRLNSKDVYEGTGLGLALCKKIVERHQGQIHATSAVGEGATFTLLLPFIQTNPHI